MKSVANKLLSNRCKAITPQIVSSLQEPIHITVKGYCIPTILIIQTQSSILLQSQCNYSTNVPEYIELGQQPGTSVDLLRCDCKIAPQSFQDVSIDVQHVVHCSSRHQRKNSKQIKDKNAVYNRNTINNPTSFFVQSLTS